LRSFNPSIEEFYQIHELSSRVLPARAVSEEKLTAELGLCRMSEIGACMTEKQPAPNNLTAKQYDAPSVFVPANLLREARRQGLA
jgi:hypothetical protein